MNPFIGSSVITAVGAMSAIQLPCRGIRRHHAQTRFSTVTKRRVGLRPETQSWYGQRPTAVSCTPQTCRVPRQKPPCIRRSATPPVPEPLANRPPRPAPRTQPPPPRATTSTRFPPVRRIDVGAFEVAVPDKVSRMTPCNARIDVSGRWGRPTPPGPRWASRVASPPPTHPPSAHALGFRRPGAVRALCLCRRLEAPSNRGFERTVTRPPAPTPCLTDRPRGRPAPRRSTWVYEWARLVNEFRFPIAPSSC